MRVGQFGPRRFPVESVVHQDWPSLQSLQLQELDQGPPWPGVGKVGWVVGRWMGCPGWVILPGLHFMNFNGLIIFQLLFFPTLVITTGRVIGFGIVDLTSLGSMRL